MACIRCNKTPANPYGIWQDCKSGLWKIAQRPNSGTLCRGCAIAEAKRLNQEEREAQGTLHGEARRLRIDS
jgi:hypothetical protein